MLVLQRNVEVEVVVDVGGGAHGLVKTAARHHVKILREGEDVDVGVHPGGVASRGGCHDVSSVEVKVLQDFISGVSPELHLPFGEERHDLRHVGLLEKGEESRDVLEG